MDPHIRHVKCKMKARLSVITSLTLVCFYHTKQSKAPAIKMLVPGGITHLVNNSQTIYRNLHMLKAE